MRYTISLNRNLAKLRGVFYTGFAKYVYFSYHRQANHIHGGHHFITRGKFMSTYLNPHKEKKQNNFADCPKLVIEFLNYARSIRGLSPTTVNAYYVDLRTFFKYLAKARGFASADMPCEKVPIDALDIDFIQKISKSEIYDYLYYVTSERNNTATTRSRKLSSLKSFFKYMTSSASHIKNNPVADVEIAAKQKRLPKYLTLDESITLLNNIQSDFYERDYCMITLFLNCGLRVSELVGLNTTDININSATMRVIGKGNKERIVYLNSACIEALQALLVQNEKIKNPHDARALFLSKKTKKRLSIRRVQQLVNRFFELAELSEKGYSVHKLRHTAATLLYQHGNVDLLSIKEILGHVDVSTTQIYTHLDTDRLKNAASASPLAGQTVRKKAKKSALPLEDNTDEDE